MATDLLLWLRFRWFHPASAAQLTLGHVVHGSFLQWVIPPPKKADWEQDGTIKHLEVCHKLIFNNLLNDFGDTSFLYEVGTLLGQV